MMQFSLSLSFSPLFQEAVASSESKVLMSDDKLATDDTVKCEEDGNHSNNVSDQPSASGEPHSVGKNEEVSVLGIYSRRKDYRRLGHFRCDKIFGHHY